MTVALQLLVSGTEEKNKLIQSLIKTPAALPKKDGQQQHTATHRNEKNLILSSNKKAHQGEERIGARFSDFSAMSNTTPLTFAQSRPLQSQAHKRMSFIDQSDGRRSRFRGGWTLSTMMTTMILYFALPHLSPVSGVPLVEGGIEFPEFGTVHQQEGEDLDGKDGESGRVEGFHRNVNFMVEPQGQLYLPSFLKSTQTDDGSTFGLVQGEGQQSRQGERNIQQLQRNSLEKEDGSSKDANTSWETVLDPHLYLLTEWASDSDPIVQQRTRRHSGPSLSIVNPLDVLRQRLLLEIARRKMRQSQHRIIQNAEMLQKIGRRRR